MVATPHTLAKVTTTTTTSTSPITLPLSTDKEVPILRRYSRDLREGRFIHVPRKTTQVAGGNRLTPPKAPPAPIGLQDQARIRTTNSTPYTLGATALPHPPAVVVLGRTKNPLHLGLKQSLFNLVQT